MYLEMQLSLLSLTIWELLNQNLEIILKHFGMLCVVILIISEPLHKLLKLQM